MYLCLFAGDPPVSCKVGESGRNCKSRFNDQEAVADWVTDGTGLSQSVPRFSGICWEPRWERRLRSSLSPGGGQGPRLSPGGPRLFVSLPPVAGWSASMFCAVDWISQCFSKRHHLIPMGVLTAEGGFEMGKSSCGRTVSAPGSERELRGWGDGPGHTCRQHRSLPGVHSQSLDTCLPSTSCEPSPTLPSGLWGEGGSLPRKPCTITSHMRDLV